MADTPMQLLANSIRQHGLVRFVEHCAEMYPSSHLKDLVFERMEADRTVVVDGKKLVNFGSDSFLGFDVHPRVQEAIRLGLRRWGTHNGASRAFSSVAANIEAEEKIAQWLGTESSLIYPSVTLANLGAIPGLVGKKDLIVLDEHAHNSMQEGARIAKANGTRVVTFAHSNPKDLLRVLQSAGDYRVALVAVDGVYSMSGSLPPLKELNEICLKHRAVLYVDDAHATGVLGTNGRGTVLDALGSYDNALVVGSLSKAFSCAGGFVGCSAEFQRLLKIRSNSYVFGGPVPPPYLEGICAVCDLLNSPEYDAILWRLRNNVQHFSEGAQLLGYTVLGGKTPIISLLIGNEEKTLQAGQYLFEKGFYVQSVVFPAVAYGSGVLRVQVNANHSMESINRLLNVLSEMRSALAVNQKITKQDQAA